MDWLSCDQLNTDQDGRWSPSNQGRLKTRQDKATDIWLMEDITAHCHVETETQPWSAAACVCVRQLISETSGLNFTSFCACCLQPCSALFRHCCDTLCTSAFVGWRHVCSNRRCERSIVRVTQQGTARSWHHGGVYLNWRTRGSIGPRSESDNCDCLLPLWLISSPLTESIRRTMSDWYEKAIANGYAQSGHCWSVEALH